MDLATLRFTVETKQLDDAVKKVKALADSAATLGKSSKDLAAADKIAAEAALKLAQAEEKLSQARLNDAKAADTSAKATERKQKADDSAAKSTEKVTASVTSASRAIGGVDKIIERQEFRLQGLTKGFSSAESGILAMARQANASAADMAILEKTLKEIRTFVSDPFDNSASFLRKIQKDITTTETMLAQTQGAFALTRKQIVGLADDTARLTAAMTREGKSQDEIQSAVQKLNQEYIQQAAALDKLQRELAEKEAIEKKTITTAEQARKAAEDQARAAERAGMKYGEYKNKLRDTFNEQLKSVEAGAFVSKSLINQVIQLERLGRQAGMTNAEIKKAAEELLELGRKANIATRQVNIFTQSMNVFKGVLSAIVVTDLVGGITAIGRGLITTSDSVTNFQNRLQSVTNETGNFAKRFDQILSIANDARVPVADVGTLFTRLIPVMTNLGKSTSETLNVTRSFSALLALSGTTTSEASSALIQFSQAMGKGKLDGDEFRTITETIPGLMQLLSKELGKTEAELRAMSESGRLTASMLSDVLGKNADELTNKIKGMQLTVSQATTLLKNAFTNLVADSDRTRGTVALLADGIEFLAENLEGLVTVIGVLALGAGLRWVGNLYSYFKSAAVGSSLLSAALTVMSAAISRVATAALLFTFSNPITAGIAAITAVVGAGVLAWNAYNEATSVSIDISKQTESPARKEIQLIREKTEALNKYNEAKGYVPKTEPKKTMKDRGEDITSGVGLINHAKAVTDLIAKGKPTGYTGTQLMQLFKDAADTQSALDKSAKAAKIKADGDAKKAADEALKELTGNQKDRQFNKELESYAAKAGKTVEEYSAMFGNVVSALRAKIYASSSDTFKSMELINSKLLENTVSTETKKYEAIRNSQNAQEQILRSNLENRLITEGEFATSLVKLTDDSYSARELFLSQYEQSVEKSANKEKESYQAQYNAYVKSGVGAKELADAQQKLSQKNSEVDNSLRGVRETITKLKEASLADYFKDMSNAVDKAAKSTFALKAELKKFDEDEQALAKKRQSQTDLEDRLRYASPEQAAFLSAQADEVERLTEKVDSLNIKYTESVADMEGAKSAIEALEIRFNTGKETLSSYNEQVERLKRTYDSAKDASVDLKKNIDDTNASIGEKGLDAGNKALIRFNKDEQAKFSNSVADALETGLFEGSEKGAKKLREIIEAELRKPISVFIKAIVGEIIGGKTSGSGSTFGNLIDAGSKLFTGDFVGAAASASNLPGIGNLFNLGKSGYDFITGGSTPAGSIANGATYLKDIADKLDPGALKDLFNSGSNTALSVANNPFVQGLGGAGSYSNLAQNAGSELAGNLVGGLLAGVSAVSVTKLLSGEYKAKGSQTAAAIVGGVIGVINPLAGMLVGGLVGGFINRAFGMGKKKIRSQGIEGTFGQNGFDGRTFQEWTQKGGWFRKNRKGTNYGALDSATDTGLDQSFSMIKLKSMGIASQLGLGLETVLNYSKYIKLALTNDTAKNQEIITKLFSDMEDEIATRLVPNIEDFALEGEKASDTLMRLGKNLTDVNGVLFSLGQTMFKLSVVSADSATQLLDLFGGLDNYRNAAQTYMDLFYSESEKMNLATASVAAGLASVGIALPKTNEEYRKLVESMDLNTDQGRQQYSVLLKLAPAFDTVTKAMQAVREEAEKSAEALRKSIKDSLFSTKTPEQQFSELLSNYNIQLAKANSQTGQQQAQSGETLAGMIEPLLAQAAQVYASSPAFFEIQKQVLGQAEKLANTIDPTGATKYFANGGVFTNSVVSQPTAFSRGVMGEAGPEAIVPLTRTSTGELGVKSTAMDVSPIVRTMSTTNMHLEALVRLQQSANAKIVEKLDDLENRFESIENLTRLESSS